MSNYDRDDMDVDPHVHHAETREAEKLQAVLEEMIGYRQRELDTALAVEKEAQKSVAYHRGHLTKLYAIRTLLRAREEARQTMKETN
jgi:hypothetical protein